MPVTSSWYNEHGLTAEGFAFFTAKAKRMTDAQLQFAVKDCHECIRMGINPLRYTDESSCYHMVLHKHRCPITE